MPKTKKDKKLVVEESKPEESDQSSLESSDQSSQESPNQSPKVEKKSRKPKPKTKVEVEGKVLNPLTNRLVKIGGKAHQAMLKTEKKK